MRLPYPRRYELRAKSYDKQYLEGRYPIYRPTEHFQAGRINPMRILENHQHWIVVRQPDDLRDQRFERSLPALFRGKLEPGISSIVSERKHFRKQGSIPGRGWRLSEHGIELVELHFRRIVVRQAGSPFHLPNDRIERTVCMVGGAVISQARMGFSGQMFQNRGREPRFPDTCFAREQDDLSLTFPCPGPAAKKQFGFFLPPDEWSQPGRMQGVEAARDRTPPQSGPGSRRSGNALEVQGPEIPEFEDIA